MTKLEEILELGRWAPSGDNTQPWRFEIVDELNAVIYGYDTREHCVYDLDGHPSQMSIGALIETISIAASVQGWKLRATRRVDTLDTRPTFDLNFSTDEGMVVDRLHKSIVYRTVYRRPMSFRALTTAEKGALETSVGRHYKVLWLEGAINRFNAARLMFGNAKLRLTMPEAYQVHRSVIQWNSKFSEDRVPDQALGIDPVTARLMRFVMQSWQRVEFFNRFLAGTWVPRIQMDLLPSLACAAHFVIYSKTVPLAIDDFVSAGRAVQRFWLTVTDLGIYLQPEMTPIIFARYARENVAFSTAYGMQGRAARLATQLSDLVGVDVATLGVFMGRVGSGGRAMDSRSLRRPIGDLMARQS